MSALRPYQSEALDALVKGWHTGGQRLGVSLPTGVGKTHIMAHLTKREAEQHAGTPGRVMLLLHRDTLVEQTVAKLRGTLDPLTSVGVLKAERNELGADVIVASVHSLRSERRLAQLPPIKMCVVDEAHVSVSPTYRRVFDRIGAFDDGARLAGFTATWTRSDALGLGDVWQEVVYHKTIQWAVRNGHLVKPRGVRVGVGVDTSGVKTSRTTGDFAEGDLERVVMLEEIRDAVVAGVQRHGAGRPGVLFAPTVDSARYFAEGLEAAGITTAEIIHSTSPTLRRARFAAHRDGSIRVLVTCTALAEGWDAPHCSLGILCRPTKHEGLFVQMAGRLLRPWPGKTDALLLDAVGATTDVHLRNVIDLSVTSETTTGEPVEEDPDAEPTDPLNRDRKARVRQHDTEVELFAGTQVQWLTSPVGVPFVPVGDGLVFIVEGQTGWCVGQAASRLDDYGRPSGRWVAEGLSQEDALTLASDHAECEGEHLARRSSRWRVGPPSEKQIAAALRMGIVTEGLTRGQVSDRMSQIFAGRVLAPFAQWSTQWRA